MQILSVRTLSALCRTLLLTLLMLFVPVANRAQAKTSSDVTQSLASRSQLQAELAEAERTADSTRSGELRAKKRAQAAQIRQRLTAGDLRVGDRIALRVLGETTLTDTFTVRAGPSITLPGLTEVPLAGVLRSELRDHLTATLKRYLKEPSVEAVPLLRISVTGEVARPGYYSVPFEALLSDAIMLAGGATASSDLRRTVVHRGESTVLDASDVQSAIAAGSTFDKVNLIAGDEIAIGARRNTNWPFVLGIVGTLLGVATFLTTSHH
jgi:protein involved in polysaccharide export with SLBB domain